MFSECLTLNNYINFFKDSIRKNTNNGSNSHVCKDKKCVSYEKRTFFYTVHQVRPYSILLPNFFQIRSRLNKYTHILRNFRIYNIRMITFAIGFGLYTNSENKIYNFRSTRRRMYYVATVRYKSVNVYFLQLKCAYEAFPQLFIYVALAWKVNFLFHFPQLQFCFVASIPLIDGIEQSFFWKMFECTRKRYSVFFFQF